ncbi:MAG: hypothetical protein JW990_10920, partial [Thermoleophilia bacterium]|nr:hypothetical protein [Thermoleophilia bacterium]
DIKQMKDTVHAAPDLVEQSMKMAANAQALAAQQQAAAAQALAQQQAAMAAAAGGDMAAGPDFEPVAGVSLELYAEISKGLAAYNYDQNMAPMLAGQKGVSPEAWQTAVDTWNARMQTNPAVGQRFNALYMGRA